MPPLLSRWAIDTRSFWIGFAAASLLALTLYLLRGRLAAARKGLGGAVGSLRERLASDAEQNHRADLVRLAEAAHLASPLCRLSQVLVEPGFMAPPAPVDPLNPAEPEMFTSLPHLPDWPVLAAAFKLPGLTLADLWASESHVLIVGEPGAGKSTALAALAIRVASRNEDFGGQNGPDPFLIHAADVSLAPTAHPGPAEALTQAVQCRASALTAPRLPAYIRGVLKFGCALLLIDGLDELPSPQLSAFADWLGSLLKAHPKTRVIAAGPSAGYGPLVKLGLNPIPMQDWAPEAQRQLIRNWARAWTEARAASQKSKPPPPPEIDPAILSNWLGTGNFGRSPLELTLKLWAGFAGDALGPGMNDALEAYVHRHAPDPLTREALGALALGMSRRDGRLPHRDAVETVKPVLAKAAASAQADPADVIFEWTLRGLLARRGGDQLAFSHPLVGAYLVAKQKTSDSITFLETPVENESPLVLQCASALLDLGPLLTAGALEGDDPVMSKLWGVGRLLRNAPGGARWRGETLRRLAGVFMEENAPQGRRARALAALVSAREPSVAQVLRPALASPEPEKRRLAALGLGAMKDSASVPRLSELLVDPEPVVRWAACLALAAIGGQAAIEALATAMLQGDEDIRRSAAEALARDPEQGHPILKEAMAEEDILLRRAAIFGLVKVGEPWAINALKQVEMTEGQWVVRSAATEALKAVERPAARVPQPPPPPENLPWLIAWAAKRGMGVPPGPPALTVLFRVTTEGTPDERAAAVEALGYHGNASVARELYLALNDADARVRDHAFEALHRIASTGEKLPPPGQYGLN